MSMTLEERQCNVIKIPHFGITHKQGLNSNLEQIPNIWKT